MRISKVTAGGDRRRSDPVRVMIVGALAQRDFREWAGMRVGVFGLGLGRRRARCLPSVGRRAGSSSGSWAPGSPSW